MSTRSGAIRQPAGDGSSFDLSKHSPEQIAQLFARWKDQRKRLARDTEREPGQDAAEQKSAAPQVVRFTPAARPLAQPDPEPQPANTREQAPGVRHYSADFSAILTSGDRATVHRVKRLKVPAAVVTAPARPAHGAGMRWTLAIAVSFIALTAAAGAAYWSQQATPVIHPPAAVAVAAPAQPEPVVQQPLETQTAAPFLPAATRLPEAEPWSTALLVDPASGSPLVEASGSPSVVEVAQEPLSANHKSIQTTSSTASGPAPSIPMAQASAEAPGDFVTSAGGSSPTAEAGHEAAPPTRQAANSAERGNQRDRLQLDLGSASGSTIDRNGSAAASRSAQGENDPSGNGTAGGSDVGSSANAGSSGGSSSTGGNAGTDSSGVSASGGDTASSASSDSGGDPNAGGTSSSASGSDASSGASSHAGHKGGGNATASGSDATSGASGSADGSGASSGASGDSDTGASAESTGNSDGSSSGSVGGAVDGAVGGVHDAVGGALGGMGKPADGIGKPDGKGKGASAGGKAKGKDKDKDKGSKGGKGGGKGKG